MKKILFLFLFSAYIQASEKTSEQAPNLSGTIEISVKTGTINANLRLENMPNLENYLIFLNTGFNIQYFRDHTDSFNYTLEKEYNVKYSNESFGYYIQDEAGKNKLLPSSLQFKYTGKFPVIGNMDKASESGDWKGNIAFNGKTIRADGLQTAWYPVLYDINKDKRYESVTYDIEIICQDCRSIYVNGSKPITSTKGRFQREKPIELALFAGDYDIADKKGNYFLNSTLSEEQLTEFGTIASAFMQYYQRILSIPYGEDLVFIETTPVSKKDAWLFVSYPSIVSIMQGPSAFTNIFDKDKSSSYQAFFAHEIAHYYFGTYRQFNSALGDMFLESFAEYLALKATKNLVDEKTYLDKIKSKLSSLIDQKHIPIKDIKNASDYGDRNQYVYIYAPLIWLAVEQEIGEKSMWQWLNKMLTVETELTNYAFMIQTLAEVLHDRHKLDFLIKHYFSNDDVIKKASSVLKPLQAN